MKGYRSQRGSRSRQTGGTVLRLHRPGAYWWQSNLHRAPTAADGRIGRRVRWWPLSLCLGGPGEPSGGSVRPRGRPLRPDGVRTAPMRARTDPRHGKGVNHSRKHLAGRRQRLFLTTCSDGSKPYMILVALVKGFQNHIGFATIRATGEECMRNDSLRDHQSRLYHP